MATVDNRHIGNGFEIPTEMYSDQPYIVKTDDGAWLCCLTTGAGSEGQSGQHVVCFRSMDQGRNWAGPIDVEPADGPEASYAVMLKVPSGRVYCFYNHNTDNVQEVKADKGVYETGLCERVDSLGHYVFKYSDDHGKTWSPKRYEVPVREMAIDKNNADGGKLRYFWNVGKPIVHDGAAYMSLHKVGGFGSGFFTSTEGVLIKSDNILAENDPERLHWQTLPDGDHGLRTPPGGGPVAEEQSYCVLSDGSFYCVYRTIDGHPTCSYSRDGGHNWQQPQYKSYADGRRMKHPRAANFAWRLENGYYLYWFHNHGGRFVAENAKADNGNFPYEDRNPVWLSAGREIDSANGKLIEWSQPEIVLYDDDTFVRMSYPDLVEQDGKVYLTETQKDTARVHEIDGKLLAKMFAGFDNATAAKDGLIAEYLKDVPDEIAMPRLPEFCQRDYGRADHGMKRTRKGFTIEMWVEFADLQPWQTLLTCRDKQGGAGVAVNLVKDAAAEICVADGRGENLWKSDPGMLTAAGLHHLAIIVDSGPCVISFVIDGKFNDGGDYRQFGWGRFNPNLRHANGAEQAKMSKQVKGLRIYDRAITTAETVGNFKAGKA